MAAVILTIVGIFCLMILWHALRACGFRRPGAALTVAIVGALLVALLGGQSDNHRHH